MACQGNLTETHRGMVLIGELPDDFLRLPSSPGGNVAPQSPIRSSAGRMEQLDRSLLSHINISLAEARLMKNYGVGRMNLYCRVRVGSRVEVTRTGNAGKNPRWNHNITCALIPGVTSVLMEILDERTFSEDERVAWAHIELSDAVISGRTVLDNWFDLNGKQGTGAEGQIKLVISCTPPVGNQQFVNPAASVVPHPVATLPQQQAQPMPAQQQQQQQRPDQPQVVRVSQSELQSLLDMFPSVQKDVVVSVLEACGGDMDVAVTNLLTISET